MDLASISKARAHVPEELLLPVIARLSAEARDRTNQTLGNKAGLQSVGSFGGYIPRVVDSSVFAALPKMTWALFGAGMARKDGRKSASIRYHVSFDLIQLCPLSCAITAATVDEKKKWKDIRAGKSTTDPAPSPSVEIGDRNFGSNYRIIWLGRPDKPILLATNLPGENAPAAMVAEMYHHRWQIELFFWWLKKIMKVGHRLVQSEKGVRIQLYLVMILALLLQLQTGTGPTKRMIELLQFHVQGLASESELLEGLKKRAREADLARASSRKRYLAKKEQARK
jgi:hypothetical protein